MTQVVQEPAEEAEPGILMYFSQPGESLWDIANEHMTEEYDSPKTYIKEVKSINSLTDVDKIYAGQRIVIPYYSTELK